VSEGTAALDRFIDDNIKSMRTSFDSVIGQLNSDEEKYKNYRNSAVTGAGTIVVPTLLTLSTLNIVAPDQARILYEVIIIATAIAGIAALILTIQCSSLASTRSTLQREFSPLGFVLDYPKNAYRGELTAHTGPVDVITKDYYDFFLILHTAVIYRLVHLSGTRLDETARSVFEGTIKFTCDATEWDVLERERGKALMKGSDYVRTLLDDYKAYCKKLNDATHSPVLETPC